MGARGGHPDAPGRRIDELELLGAKASKDCGGEAGIGSKLATEEFGLHEQGIADGFHGGRLANLRGARRVDEVAGGEVGLEVDDKGAVDEVEAADVEAVWAAGKHAGDGEPDGVGTGGGTDGKDAVERLLGRLLADTAGSDLEDVARCLVEPGEHPNVRMLFKAVEPGGELGKKLDGGGHAEGSHVGALAGGAANDADGGQGGVGLIHVSIVA